MDQNRKIDLPVGVLPESVDSSLCNSADLQFLWLAVQDQQWVNLDLKVQRSINAPMEVSIEPSRSLACKNNFFDVILVKLLRKAEVNRLNSFEALSLTQCAVWPLWSWHHMTTYYSINTIVRSFFFQASLHLMLNYDKTVISGSFEPIQDFWGISLSQQFLAMLIFCILSLRPSWHSDRMVIFGLIEKSLDFSGFSCPCWDTRTPLGGAFETGSKPSVGSVFWVGGGGGGQHVLRLQRAP